MDSYRELVEEAALTENGWKWRIPLTDDYADLRVPLDYVAWIIRIVKVKFHIAELHFAGSTPNAQFDLGGRIRRNSKDSRGPWADQYALATRIDERRYFLGVQPTD